MKEKISALLDDELPKRERDEALDKIRQYEELSELWHRYNLIGAVCRREIKALSPGLVKRVAQLTGHEQPDKSYSGLPYSKERSFHRGWYPALAIAATLLAVTGIGMYVLNQGAVNFDNDNQSASVAIVDHVTRWENAVPEHEAQLNALLVEHGEFTPMAGLNGLISYAKFVSYDAKQ